MDISKTRIGLAGLGTMGSPMASHLAKACPLFCLYDIDQARVQTLQAELADINPQILACQSAAELGENCDVLITMLPDATVVAAVLNGTSEHPGAAQTLSTNALVIDMSSSDPFATRQLGESLKPKSITVLDAPVSGGVRKAISGSLAIMLGGDDDAPLAAAESLLQCLGSVYRTGSLGSGHATKALNNYVSAAGLAAASEAALIGSAFGLDPNQMMDVINASTGRNNSTENKMKPFVLNNNFAAAGFSLDLMAKDISTAADLAQNLDLNLPGVEQARELWRQAQQTLSSHADHTEIYQYLALSQFDKK